MVKVFVDSVSDMHQGLLTEGEDITVIPLTVYLEEDAYEDSVDLHLIDVYRAMTHKGIFPRTAAPSPQRFINAFSGELQEGHSVLCFTVSSGISATYQNACLAAESLKAVGRVDVIDSKQAGIGIGIGAILAARAAKAGVDHDTILFDSRRRMDKMHTFVMLDTLDYLVMGGRISSFVAKAAGILNIKPIITFDEAGKVTVCHKPIGAKKGLKWMCQMAVEKGVDLTHTILGFAHGETPEWSDQLRALVEKSMRFKETVTTQIGCVVGTYVGKTGVGIFFEEA